MWVCVVWCVACVCVRCVSVVCLLCTDVCKCVGDAAGRSPCQAPLGQDQGQGCWWADQVRLEGGGRVGTANDTWAAQQTEGKEGRMETGQEWCPLMITPAGTGLRRPTRPLPTKTNSPTLEEATLVLCLGPTLIHPSPIPTPPTPKPWHDVNHCHGQASERCVHMTRHFDANGNLQTFLTSCFVTAPITKRAKKKVTATWRDLNPGWCKKAPFLRACQKLPKAYEGYSLAPPCDY